MDQGSGNGEKKGSASAPPSSPNDEVLRQLLKKAEARKIPNKPETLRRNLEAWIARWGPERVDRILSNEACTGMDVNELHDSYFRGNGREQPRSIAEKVGEIRAEESKQGN